MHRSSGPLLCLLVAAAAQNHTVVTVFRYSWDDRLAASVVSANPTATTYSLGCPSGLGSTCFDYNIGIPTITIVGGPSTAAQTLIVEEGGATVIVTCQLTATAPYGGPCVRSDRFEATSYTTSFEATANSEFATFGPVTVTGGLEKLQAAAATGSGAGSGAGGGAGGGDEAASPTGEGSGAVSTPVPTKNSVGTVRVGASIFSVGVALLWGIW